MAEWGYISFEELEEIKIPPGFEVDCDCTGRSEKLQR